MPDLDEGPITSFRMNHYFLSNFYPAHVTYLGVSYQTSEHAYQAQKTTIPAEQEDVRQCATPGKAKRMGKLVTMRPDWLHMKARIMGEILWEKFRQNPDIAVQLINTDPRPLIEGNTWGDAFWGAEYDPVSDTWIGRNELGVQLMAVRARFIKGEK